MLVCWEPRHESLHDELYKEKKDSAAVRRQLCSYVLPMHSCVLALC